MPINFGTPNVDQLVDPSYISIRENLMWLAKWGEGDASITGAVSGVKRLNASGLVEQHNGTGFVEKVMGYLKKTDDTFTGTLAMSGNIVGPSSNSIKALSADPLATIYTGGFAQFWGSAAANPGLVQIGNSTAQPVDIQPGGAVRMRIKAGGQAEVFAPTTAIPSVYAYVNAASPYGMWLEQSNSGGDSLYVANAQNTAGSESGFSAFIGGITRGILYGTAADLDFYLRAEAILKFQAGGGSTRGQVSPAGFWQFFSAAGGNMTAQFNGTSASNGVISQVVSTNGTGALQMFTNSGIADWAAGVGVGADAFSIFRGRNTVAAGTELLRLDSAGTLNLYQSGIELHSTTPSIAHIVSSIRRADLEFSVEPTTGRGQAIISTYRAAGGARRNIIECLTDTFQNSFVRIRSVQQSGINDSMVEANATSVGFAFNGLFSQVFSSGSSTMGSNVIPGIDNTFSVGQNGNRWSSVWAVNGTIQTSDESDKTDVAPVDASLANRFVETLAADGVIAYRWIVGGNEVESVPDGDDITHVDDVEMVPVEHQDKQGRIVTTIVEAPVKREVRKPRFKTVTKPIPGKRRHWGFSAQRVKAAVDVCGIDDFGGWVRDEQGKQHLRPDQLMPFLYVSTADLLRRVAQLEQRLGDKQ